jgi:hypothetical protein
LLSTAMVAAGLTVVLVGGGLAQDATPTSMQEATEDDAYAPYAAHLHTGTCDEPSGEPVAILAPLELPAWVSELAEGEATTSVDAATFGNAPVPVAASTTEVMVPIADIVSGGHAITVERDDPSDPEDDVACGNVGGVVDENGDLFVGLEEANGSGHHGVAWLHDTGTTTTVVVFLAHPEEQENIEMGLAGLASMASPAAPAMATPAGEAMATPAMGAATPTT